MSKYLTTRQLDDLFGAAPKEAAPAKPKREAVPDEVRETVKECASFLRGLGARVGDPHMDRRLAFNDIRAWVAKLEAL